MAPPGVLYAIYIVNKSGGLVYNRVRDGRGMRGAMAAGTACD